MSEAFKQLKTHAGKTLQWLEVKQQHADGQPVDAIRIIFLELGLRYPSRLYRCPTTGRIWPREVLGCAPETGSTNLEAIDVQSLDSDPRFTRQRQELVSSPAFSIGLWAEEHSAQLAAKENRRLQDLFKGGIRNILSSTTTMELGIDIGGLNAVLMGNVPPGKANYLQRAGRAGRRADGSSIVTTFCHPRPFDREVFYRFDDYLARSPRSPKIFLNRNRIVRRHAHAFLLGNFFRAIYPPDMHVGAMNAFGNMGSFCGISLPPFWRKSEQKPLIAPFQQDWGNLKNAVWHNPANHEPGLEGHFLNYLEWIRDYGEKDIRPSLERLLHGTGVSSLLADWYTFFNNIINDLAEAIRNWREEFDLLLRTWHMLEESTSGVRAQANALCYQMRALYEMTVIEALSDRQFMPSYGFPTGLQKLRVIVPDESKAARCREEDQYRLERSGLVALGEYVPGSQLLVGGKLITSHGLLKHWTGADIDNRVFGHKNGLIDAKILFIAEAPGRLGADRSGIPLRGDQTGKNFEYLLNQAQLTRNEIFISNAVLCNPRDGQGYNAPPALEEIENCADHLRETIHILRPHYVIALGNVALKALNCVNQHTIILSRHVGIPQKWDGRWLIALYHPSPRAQTYRPLSKQVEDFQRLGAFIKRHGVLKPGTEG